MVCFPHWIVLWEAVVMRGGSDLRVRRQAEEAACRRDLHGHIGRSLRETYDEIVSETVPTRFIELLKRLERGRVKLP